MKDAQVIEWFGTTIKQNTTNNGGGKSVNNTSNKAVSNKTGHGKSVNGHSHSKQKHGQSQETQHSESNQSRQNTKNRIVVSINQMPAIGSGQSQTSGMNSHEQIHQAVSREHEQNKVFHLEWSTCHWE